MFAARKKPPRSDGRHTPSLPGLLRTTVIAMAVFTVLISAILTALGWLSGVDVLPWSPGMFSSTQLSDLVRAAVSIGTLAGGTFAAVYAYRKQRIDEAGSHRADAEQLSKRYQDAAAQLGHERAAVRLAGIYAIGRLADDWPENRQMCVDLLCAYLRMPYTPGEASDDEGVVRRTVFQVMRNHLRSPENPLSWCDLSFDFSGGTYDTVQLAGCHFHNHVSFTNAKFVGLHTPGRNELGMHFSGSLFRGGVSFFHARFDGAIAFFEGTRFEDGYTDFGGASFRSFNLFFRDARFLGGKVYFGGTKFIHSRTDDRLPGSLGNVWFDRATFGGAEVVFNGAWLDGYVDMSFADVDIRSGKLDLSGLELMERVGEDEYPKVHLKPSFVAEETVTLPAEKSARWTVEMPVGGPEKGPPTK